VVDLALIDTTEFTKSPLLRPNGWPDLLKRSRSGQVRVVVSEVTLSESARQFEEALAKETAGLARAASKVERQYGLSVPDLQHLEPDAAGAAESYLDRVRRDLEDNNVEILPIRATPHERLIERDLGRRRPFDGNGRGYRDALIWESLLEELEMSWSPLEVVIVTGNTNDFGGTSSGLAEDLHEDLSDMDPPMEGSLVATLPALLRLLPPLRLPNDVSQAPELSPEAVDAVSTALIGASEVLEGDVSY
jgi:hypothetical protein